jgi:NHL repeat/Secretion system C-terminal sorting domain
MKPIFYKLLFSVCILLTSPGAQAQIIRTIAGIDSGSYFSGDGGPATAANFHTPTGVAMDTLGNIYVADNWNHRVRKIDTFGIVSTFAGNGTLGYSGDGAQATDAKFNQPTNVTTDRSGNVYISDEFNHVIRKVNASGIVTTIVGTGMSGYTGDNGPATAAHISSIYQTSFDRSGNLYIADQVNHVIRKVDTFGIITTVAGNGTLGYSGDGGPATAANLNAPSGIVSDSIGNLFIGDRLNNAIRKVDTSGIISTIAGTGTSGYTGDGGPATAALLGRPIQLAIDSNGNLLFSDSYYNVIRIINPAGMITTIAGSGAMGFGGDGGPAIAAALNYPDGLIFDRSGNLIFVDAGNNRVRKISKPVGTLITRQIVHHNKELILLPNPNNGVFIIKGKVNVLSGSNLNFEVSDMLGQQVFKGSIIADHGEINSPITLSKELPSGIYQLHITGEGENEVLRFVLEK